MSKPHSGRSFAGVACPAPSSSGFKIGSFIADFACRSLRLAIELDGGQHSENERDATRTRVIELHGYRVIRFWNHEVSENLDGVLQTIATEIDIARNTFSPRGEG